MGIHYTAMEQADGSEAENLKEAAWIDVIQNMDRTYADLVAYQIELESKNADLEQMQTFVTSVLGAMTDVLVVCDNRGAVIDANEAMLRHSGHRLEQLVGRKVSSLFTADDGARLGQMINKALSKGVPQAGELSALDAKGEPLPLEVHIDARLGPRRRALGVVLIGRPMGELRRMYRELTRAHLELKQTQAQLVHSEKMASLGRLVSGVAHELNNPISFVYGSAHALTRYVDRLETYFQRIQAGASREELANLRMELKLDRAVANLRDAVSGALEGSERVRDIVEQLRYFSAEGRVGAEPFDLVAVTRTALTWVIRGREPRPDIDWTGLDSLRVVGRSGHIQQVIMNIVQNACDSIEDLAEQKIAIDISQDGADAVVTIADNGAGLADDVLANIFDPFFTTKPVGKGTGLGLSISYKTVQDHGGALTACNRSSGGALFEMRLPIAGNMGKQER